MKKIVVLVSLMISFCFANAQVAGQDVEMADVMRSSGKIYVVIATIVIIFIGLAIYLFSIDRRLRKIEKEN